MNAWICGKTRSVRQNPKDGEQCLNIAKSEETLVEARSDTVFVRRLSACVSVSVVSSVSLCVSCCVDVSVCLLFACLCVCLLDLGSVFVVWFFILAVCLCFVFGERVGCHFVSVVCVCVCVPQHVEQIQVAPMSAS